MCSLQPCGISNSTTTTSVKKTWKSSRCAVPFMLTVETRQQARYFGAMSIHGRTFLAQVQLAMKDYTKTMKEQKEAAKGKGKGGRKRKSRVKDCEEPEEEEDDDDDFRGPKSAAAGKGSPCPPLARVLSPLLSLLSTVHKLSCPGKCLLFSRPTNLPPSELDAASLSLYPGRVKKEKGEATPGKRDAFQIWFDTNRVGNLPTILAKTRVCCGGSSRTSASGMLTMGAHAVLSSRIRPLPLAQGMMLPW